MGRMRDERGGSFRPPAARHILGRSGGGAGDRRAGEGPDRRSGDDRRGRHPGRGIVRRGRRRDHLRHRPVPAAEPPGHAARDHRDHRRDARGARPDRPRRHRRERAQRHLARGAGDLRPGGRGLYPRRRPARHDLRARARRRHLYRRRLFPDDARLADRADRPRAGRDPARAAGHARRPEFDRRRHPALLAPARRRRRRLYPAHLRQLRPDGASRRAELHHRPRPSLRAHLRKRGAARRLHHPLRLSLHPSDQPGAEHGHVGKRLRARHRRRQGIYGGPSRRPLAADRADHARPGRRRRRGRQRTRADDPALCRPGGAPGPDQYRLQRPAGLFPQRRALWNAGRLGVRQLLALRAVRARYVQRQPLHQLRKLYRPRAARRQRALAGAADRLDRQLGRLGQSQYRARRRISP